MFEHWLPTYERSINLESVKYHLNIMARKKAFRFSFFLILLLCICLPFIYALQYKGYSMSKLPSAYTLYIGNAMGLVWDYIQLLFPFLVIFPYSMSFYEESKEGTILYIQARSGRKQYYISQLITCFIGGFVIIFIPFILNILLNSIIFPEIANDYISTYDRYTYNWSGGITGSTTIFPVLSKGYMLKELYINYPQLHNVLFALLSGVVAGIMAMLAYAFSIFIKKSRLFIFFLMYLFFQIFTMVDSVMYDNWSEETTYVCVSLATYLSNGLLQVGRIYWLFYAILLFVVLFVIKTIKGRIAEDEL